MKGYRFTALLQNDHWIIPAFVGLDEEGNIEHIKDSPLQEVSYEKIDGLAIPSFINAHSHAFQYAMAGLAEIHPNDDPSNDFWSWRSRMYEIALSIDPESMQNIAAMLYSEMVRHGYSHVVEFHYLHHDKNGKSYSDIAELSHRLIEAAKIAGIKITLIPMLYQKGGFNTPPQENQRRFTSSTEDYLKICEAVKKVQDENTFFGFGAHSLRAADKDNIATIIDQFGDKYPFHIHIAEQLKEVEDCLQNLNRRPVEYLLDNFNVKDNFNLVHATHLTENEVHGIATAKANVVLCPSTEGNLGDGLFKLHSYQENNGRWCIGTDSQIGLNPLEELRILDYGQRLTTHKRNTFAPAGGDGAYKAMENAILNGRSAAGLRDSKRFFEIGRSLDALVIKNNHPLLDSGSKYWLSTLLYHFDASDFYGTIINGKWVVKDQSHLRFSSIEYEFKAALYKLKIRNK